MSRATNKKATMNREAFDAAVKQHGAWLPEGVFLSLIPAGVVILRASGIEELAEELDVMTVGGATGTKYRAEDLKAALGYR
jgi:hypothetical protein